MLSAILPRVVKLKPWHLLALVGFVYACGKPKRSEGPVGAGDPNPEPSEPMEPVRDLYVFAHDRALVPVALKVAKRIEAASGVKVHVNEYGTQPTAQPIFGSDFLCGSGTEGRSAGYGIAMARDCNVDPEKVLLHELIHQLGVGHLVLPDRGIMNAEKDQPLDGISEADLNALCSVRNCTKFVPEV
jgi:hypothetical protein